MSWTASSGRPIDDITGIKWIAYNPEAYPYEGPQVLGDQGYGGWSIAYPNPDIFDSEHPTLYRLLTQADIDAADAASVAAGNALRQKYRARGWIYAGTFHFAYDRAPGGDLFEFIRQTYPRPSNVPANYLLTAGDGGASPEYGTDFWYVNPNDPIFAPRTTGHDFFTETLNIDTGPELLQQMPGLIIPIVALTVGAGAALIGAGAAEGAGSAAFVGDIPIAGEAGTSIYAGAAAESAAGGAAFVGDIPVAGEAGTSIYAADAAAVGAESGAGTVIGDASADTLATEGTSIVDLADSANIGTVDIGVGAEVPASSGTTGVSVFDQMKQLYSTYKPYIDTAKTAYGTYKAATAQQSLTNTPNRLAPRPAVSAYAPLQLASGGGIVDSGMGGVMAGLLLFAVIAKARKSRA